MLAGPIGIRVSGNDSGLPAAEAPRAFDLVVAFWEEDSRTQIAQPSLPRGRPAPDGAMEDGAAEDGAAGSQEEVEALIALDLQQLLDRIDEALARQADGQDGAGQDGAGQGDETLSLAILLAALFPEADSLAELEALLKAELQILAEQPAETLSGGSVLVAAHPDDPIADLVERGLATLEESALAEGFGARLLEEGPFADPGVLDPAPGRGEPGLPAPGTGGSVYSDLYSDLASGLSPFDETLRPSDVLSGIAARVESAPQARRYDGGGDASADGSSAPASHAPVAGNDSYAKAAHLFEASFDVGLDGFGYHDDAFRGTAQPGYADGVRLGAGGFGGSGGLQVTTGGLDNNVILGMSGGWERSFNLAAATDVTLTFRYRLTQDGEFEADEYSEALVAVDGTLRGNGGNDYLARISGNGNGGADQTTGWQTFTVDLGPLAPGAHTVTIGGHNNKKTFNDEFTWVLIDEVAASDDNPLVVDAVSGLLANDSDLDGGLLTVALLSGPADGLLALNADGSFTYTPDADFIGLDSFTYTVSDGSLTDNGTATIAVGNVIEGSAAGEALTGTAGRDALYGFDGNDTLTGGAGNDRLQGGSGKDTLTGGTGADVFAYESGDGGAVLTAADLVTGFEDGSDLIGLDGALSGLSISGGGLAIGNNGGDAVVTVVGSGEFLTVIDGAFGLITDTDFLHL